MTLNYFAVSVIEPLISFLRAFAYCAIKQLQTVLEIVR